MNQEEAFKKDGMEIRAGVLQTALRIESNITLALLRLLRIKSEQSRALGYGSGAIGFSHKVSFLIDMVKLEKHQITMLNTFLEVRNVFAHVLTARSYVDCFALLKDKQNLIRHLSFYNPKADPFPNLKKEAPRDPKLSEEEQYAKGVATLTALVYDITLDIRGQTLEQITEDTTLAISHDALQAYMAALPVVFTEYQEDLKKRLTSQPPMTGIDVLNIPKEIYKAISKKYNEEFERRRPDPPTDPK